MATVMIPDFTIGMIMEKKARKILHPSINADSSSVNGKVLKYPKRIRELNGI